ncbi:MAG: amino acid adenylation domain-containing protein, partial [Acidobacteriota bacterium]|nr:amino acid adenylation domain-containing protein [Acidobacteriota bacterium]
MKPSALETLWPLSPMQEGMLFESLASERPGLYHEQTFGTILVPARARRGDLDRSALRRAWNRVLARHPALRATFFWEEVEQPVQAIHRSASMPWHELDWRRLTEGEAAESFRQLLQADRGHPFDLTRPPLQRFTLIRLADAAEGARWRFLWSFHHLLLDGWSLYLVLEEVLALYSAETGAAETGAAETGATGAAGLRLPARRAYGDFLTWLQRRGLPPADEAGAFWRPQLAGDASLGFLQKRLVPRSGAPSQEVDQRALERRLTEGRCSALEATARAAGITPAVLVEACFGLLLGRWSGRSDGGRPWARFGTVVSGRPAQLRGIEGMLGLFVNTLPVRIEVDPAESLRCFLQRIQQGSVDRRRFEHTPLAKIRRWSGRSQHEMLFEAILAFENYPRGSADFTAADPDAAGGLKVLDLNTVERLPFPVGLGVAPGDRWLLRLVYHPSRLPELQARRFLRALEELLTAVTDGALDRALDRAVATLPHLSAPERHQLRWEWSAAPGSPEGGVDLLERLAHHAAVRPEQPALEPSPLDAESSSISYGELHRRLHRLARGLRRRGIGLGDTVAVLCPRSPRWVLAALAVTTTGAAYLPLDPAYPASRRRWMLEDSGARALLVPDGTEEADENTENTIPRWSWSTVEEEGGEGPSLETPPGAAPAYLIYTSGSTGRPKGVRLGRRGWSLLVEALLRLPVRPGERASQLTSPSFDASVWEVTLALGAGATLCLVTPEEIQRAGGVGEVAAHRRLHHVSTLPSLLAAEEVAVGIDPGAKDEESDEAFPRTLFVGGEALPAGMVRRWAPGRRLFNCYGPAEITSTCSLGEPAKASVRRSERDSDDARLDEARPDAGRPAAAARLHILPPGAGSSAPPLPVGSVGELWVGGPGLAHGYHRRPALTAAAFQPDPTPPPGTLGARLYRTGDLARWTADGRLEIHGRLDDQVKIRGHRVEPGEIAAALGTHPAIAQVAVVSRPLGGELQLVAYGELVPGAEEPQPRELNAFLSRRLPPALLPGRYLFLNALPRTANDKIDRQALPDPGAAPAISRSADAGAAADAGPSGETEERLAEIWGQVLGVASVGRDDHFIDLGGDSILSLQLAGRLRREGFPVSPADLFEHPTVARLSRRLERGESAGEGPGEDPSDDLAEPPEAGEEIPLTPVQRWFLEGNPADPHHFTLGVTLEPPVDLDLRRLELALGELLQRHEALRATFEVEEETEAGQGGAVWRQRHRPTAELPLASLLVVRDLSRLPPEDAAAQQRRLADALQKCFDLSRGPMMRGLLMRMEEGPRLLLTAHHLVVDAYSWMLLLDDLEALYHRRPLPPVATPWHRWARAVARREAELLAEETSPEEPCQRLFADDEASTYGEARLLRQRLSRELSTGLDGGATRQSRTDAETLLLAALAAALAAWGGLEPGARLRLHLEGHGRDLLSPLSQSESAVLDASGTVGWLTSLAAVVVTVPAVGAHDGTVESWVHAVKTGLAAAHPLLGTRETAEVSFNFLGSLPARPAGDGAFRWLPEAPGGAPRSPHQQRRHRLEINVYRGAPGEASGDPSEAPLQVVWAYAPREIPETEMEALAASFETVAEELERCLREEPTRLWAAPDFSCPGLTREALTAALRQLPAPPEEIYELTPLQQGILFHWATHRDAETRRDTPGEGQSAAEAGAPPYVEQFHCVLEGDIDPEALRGAWARAVRRHSVLRTAFLRPGDTSSAEPLQAVLPAKAVTVPWRQEDWRSDGLDEDGEARRLEALLRSEARDMDLLRPPLLSLVLARIGARRWRFLWTHHHLLLDGWSAGQLLAEVFAVYRLGESSELPRARPFLDHIRWLRTRDRAGARDFWRSALTGAAGAVPLPPPRRSAAAGSAEVHRRLSPAEAERLQSWARRQRLTLSTLVDGAWALLLAHWSGRRKVTFGSVVSGRPPELAGQEAGPRAGGGEVTLGLFINTVPTAVEVLSDASPEAWLAGLQEQNTRRGSHEWVSLPAIRRWTRAEGEDGSNDPPELFNTLVLFESYPLDASVEQASGELGVSDAVMENRTEYPLVLTVLPGPPLELRVQYEAGRVDRTIALRALETTTRLLLELPSGAQRLAQLSPLSPAQRHQLLLETAGAAGDSPSDPAELVLAAVRRWPEATALEDPSAGIAWSFAELWQRAQARAAERRSRNGSLRQAWVIDEDQLGSRSEAVLEMLAAVLAGIPYLPLDAEAPPQRKELLRASAEDLPAEVADPVAPHPEAAAYLLFTSGSTGRPKGVVISRRAFGHLVGAAARAFGLRHRDRVLQFSALAFDVAGEELFTSWSVGATVVLPPPAARESFVELGAFLDRAAVTVINLPASFWRRWIESLAGASLPGALRRVVAGNEAVSARALQRWRELRRPGASDPVPMINAYGPTEATVTALTHRPSVPEPVPPESLPPDFSSVAVGRPLSRMRAYLLDRRGEVVPPGWPGELCLAGPGLARGYLHQPRRTAESFRPDPFSALAGLPGSRLYHTGDRARQRPDGAVEILGRLDRQLKLRGLRIEPGEIEAALAGHPAVGEAAVRMVAGVGSHSGPRLAAYFEPASNRPEPAAANETPEGEKLGDGALGDGGLEKDLRAFLGTRLPAAWVPSLFVPMPRLPRTPGGKVALGQLPAPEELATETPSAGPMPQDAAPGRQLSPAEAGLAEIWAAVLGVEEVAPEDDFFALGGDSILSLQIADMAREKGLRISPRELFQHRTLADLAAAARPVEAAEEGRRLDRGPAPLLPLQDWFFSTEPPHPEHWNQAILLRPAAELTAPAAERALRAVIAHHGALRASFRWRPRQGTWSQRLMDPAEAPFHLRRLDLRRVAGAEDRRRAFEKAAAGLHSSFDLSRPPLLAALWLEQPPEAGPRWLLVAHHLVVDGVSWRVLLQDLARSLARKALPPAVSTRAWSEALQRWAHSPAGHRQVERWAPPADPPPPLPTAVTEGDAPDIHREAAVVESQLSKELTDFLLTGADAAYGNRPEEVILTAAVLAFRRFHGTPAPVRVMLEGHGRKAPEAGPEAGSEAGMSGAPESLDLSRTVGALTALYPVALELPADDAAEALMRVKETLRRIPDGGLGYGALTAAGLVQPWPGADFSFNYLGRGELPADDQLPFALVEDAPGPAVHPLQPRPFPFDLNAVVRGGRLQLHWSFSQGRHPRATATELVQSWGREIERLLEHCREPHHAAYTPTDFPRAILGGTEPQWLEREELAALPLPVKLPVELPVKLPEDGPDGGRRRPVQDLYPLSPMQQGLVFHSLYDAGGTTYLQQLCCTLDGPLDPERFRRAWDETVARHEILRAALVPRPKGEPLQAIHRRVVLPWAQARWSPEEAGAALERALAEDARQPVDLERPPLLRFALYAVAEAGETPRRHVFLWTHHHLLLDGWSTGLVLAEVLQRYAEPSLRLPPAHRYGELIAWQRRLHHHSSETFWRRYLRRWPGPTPLPLDGTGRRGGAETPAEDAPEPPQRIVGPATVARLEALGQRRGLTLSTLVQGAWAV